MAEKDMGERALEDFEDVFADIVNGCCFGGEQVVRPEDLTPATPHSYYKVSGKLREQERDTAKFWKNAYFRIAMFGLENFTEPEDDVPLRVIGYDGAAYRDQVSYVMDANGKRRVNDNPRYPVVTLVLYFGKRAWNRPTTLLGCLDRLPERLRPYVNDYRINLIEVGRMTDEETARFRSDFRILADFVVQLQRTGNYSPPETSVLHMRETLRLMGVLTGDNRFEEAMNRYEETTNGKEPKNMCEALDVLERRGEQRGFERGWSSGRRDSLLDLMDSMHWSFEQAMRALKIPASEEDAYRELLTNDAADTP